MWVVFGVVEKRVGQAWFSSSLFSDRPSVHEGFVGESMLLDSAPKVE